MNSYDKKIFEARLKGVSFCNIKNPKWNIDQIIVRGAAISGCAIPNTEFFADIISEEILHFIMNFGYEELTYEEILLAMRMNANGGYNNISGLDMEPIVFFGNSFNVEYFAKLLKNYRSIRNLFDKKLTNKIDGYAQ